MGDISLAWRPLRIDEMIKRDVRYTFNVHAFFGIIWHVYMSFVMLYVSSPSALGRPVGRTEESWPSWHSGDSNNAEALLHRVALVSVHSYTAAIDLD